MDRVAILLALLSVVFAAEDKTNNMVIGKNFTCAVEKDVEKEGEFRVMAKGDAPASDCSLTFNAAPVTDSSCKPGLCFMFDMYAFIEDPKVSLSLQSEGMAKEYMNGSKFEHYPVCTDAASLKIILTEESGYVFDRNFPEKAYKFRLDIFNRCGSKGQVKNVKFEDVIEHAHGYHTAEEREDKERATFTTGILLGFGLASIFLVVLLIAYCYTRNSPNRAPNRSVGLPKVGGFKKKMKPNQPQSKQADMGVAYKSREAEERPHSQALVPLTSKDPEKPPVDSGARQISA